MHAVRICATSYISYVNFARQECVATFRELKDDTRLPYVSLFKDQTNAARSPLMFCGHDFTDHAPYIADSVPHRSGKLDICMLV